VASRLPGWKRRIFSYPGGELVAKSVLSVLPTHFLTVFKMPKRIVDDIDRYMRSFLWKGTDPENIRGGHCLVN
jgi:hypothetical protein